MFDGDGLDATLPLLGVYGFEDPALAPHAFHLRLRRRRARVRRRPCSTATRPGADGLAGGEAPFGICGFWAVEALARAWASCEAALERFDRVLAYANDVGLFAEQIDPAERRRAWATSPRPSPTWA